MEFQSILLYGLLGLLGLICLPLLLFVPIIAICCLPLILMAFLARWVLIGAIREYKKKNND